MLNASELLLCDVRILLCNDIDIRVICVISIAQCVYVLIISVKSLYRSY